MIGKAGLRTVVSVGWILAREAAGAQGPQGVIDSLVTLDNDTFPPGPASGRHVGLDPEMGIVVEGELTLVTDAGRSGPARSAGCRA